MANYLLSQKAIDDLSDIWEYTFQTWSENQADKYYLSLLSDCQELANKPHMGKKYPEINSEIFGYKSGEYLIFYRKSDDTTIQIIRFLHARMDLKRRIQE